MCCPCVVLGGDIATINRFFIHQKKVSVFQCQNNNIWKGIVPMYGYQDME